MKLGRITESCQKFVGIAMRSKLFCGTLDSHHNQKYDVFGELPTIYPTQTWLHVGKALLTPAELKPTYTYLGTES